MRNRLMWCRGQDPSRKAHAVYVDEWFQDGICGAEGIGVVKPTKSKQRCKTCVKVAAARGLKVT